MASISTLQLRSEMHMLAKRRNWASHEAGVILVFCIVFIIAVGLLGLCISRALTRRRERKEIEARKTSNV